MLLGPGAPPDVEEPLELVEPGAAELDELVLLPVAVAWNMANVLSALGFTANTMPRSWQWFFGLSKSTE